MVKVVKRKDGKEVKLENAAMSERERKQRLSKYIILATLALIFIGFTLNVPNVSSPQPEPEIPIDDPGFGTGVIISTENVEIMEPLDVFVAYGRLENPADLERRSQGELYYLDSGVNQMVISNMTAQGLNYIARGDYILYKAFDCGDFICMLQDGLNGNTTAAAFDVYELSDESKYLETTRVGFPSIESASI